MTEAVEQRKVVLFLVEGTSDEIALGQPIETLVKSELNLEWERFKTDVFTVRLYPESASFEVKARIADTIKAFVEKRLERGGCYYRLEDIAHIVHITDTDGAFVPESCIVRGAETTGIRYASDKIFAVNISDIKARNLEKKQTVGRMVRTSALQWGELTIPYSLFYLSRNLEHALMDKSETLDESEKHELAQLFRQFYNSHPDQFLALLDALAKDIPNNYAASWDYIRKGTRSLERHSNLRLITQVIDK